ncbi:MAG: YceI family protein [Bacteroidota bacterium]
MKKLKLLFPIIAGAFVLASCSGTVKDPAKISEALEPGEKPEEAIIKKLDTEESTITWEGTKLDGTSHDGIVGVKSGELYVVENQVVGGKNVIDMTEIVVLDLEDPEMNAKLQGHLESDDFFSVEKYPEAYYDMASISLIEDAKADEPNYMIRGNLTIKGITHGFSFPAFVSMKDDKLHAVADFSFDRSLFDVKFGSGKFFDNLGDNLIHDHVNIGVDVFAK